MARVRYAKFQWKTKCSKLLNSEYNIPKKKRVDAIFGKKIAFVGEKIIAEVFQLIDRTENVLSALSPPKMMCGLWEIMSVRL